MIESIIMKIFINARIISPSDQDNQEINSISVKDGKIYSLGMTSSINHEDSEVVDLKGAYVLPGFVDPHAHPLMYGQMMSWINVGPEKAKNITDIIFILKRENDLLDPNLPLRAFGYEHRNLSEGRHPTKKDLDQVSIERQIYVMNASGHGGSVNSLVLDFNNISANTADPKGGRFERDEDGEPTGVIWDAACDILTGSQGVKLGNHGPNFHLPDQQWILTQQFLKAQEEFIKFGVTSIGDAQVSSREFDTYLDVQQKKLLKARYSMYIISSEMERANSFRENKSIDSMLLSAGGIKMYADGTLGGWTAYFPEGYKNDASRKGQLYHDAEEFSLIFQQCAKKGFDIAIHAQSPTAIQMIITATRELKKLEGFAKSPIIRVEHCGLPTPDQIKDLAQLGIVAVSQPIHHHNWGDGVVSALGGDVGSRFNPLGEFVQNQLVFALSSDAPVGNPNPFEAIAAAMDRTTIHGTKLGDDDLRIDAQTALFAHTMGGAIALGKQDEIGSIEKGKYADFITVDQNPLSCDSSQMRQIKVQATYTGGEKVFDRNSP